MLGRALSRRRKRRTLRCRAALPRGACAPFSLSAAASFVGSALRTWVTAHRPGVVAVIRRHADEYGWPGDLAFGALNADRSTAAGATPSSRVMKRLPTACERIRSRRGPFARPSASVRPRPRPAPPLRRASLLRLQLGANFARSPVASGAASAGLLRGHAQHKRTILADRDERAVLTALEHVFAESRLDDARAPDRTRRRPRG